MHFTLAVMVLTVALPLGGDNQELDEEDFGFGKSLPSVACSISPVPSMADDFGLHEDAREPEKEPWKRKYHASGVEIDAEEERKRIIRIAQQVSDATLILGRNEKMLRAVQVGVHKLDWVSDLFRLPALGRLAHIENAVQDETLNRLAKSDDDLLTSALRKLRNLVLYWPEDSKLGRALLTSAGAVVGEDVLQPSLKDGFAGKAVATLVRRAADFTRFAEWMIQSGRGRPLNPTEADLYGYISVLRSTGAGAGQAVNNDLISGRVLGASKTWLQRRGHCVSRLPSLQRW